MTATGTSLEIASLRSAFVSGTLSTAQLTEQVLARIAQSNDPAIWISRATESAVRTRAGELDALAAADPGTVAHLPLFGIPFAVKDNIDVAGMPTTAGCPAFAYSPAETAPVVARLLAAGAVLLGKTNLDQFATGLVGTRSPYGVPPTHSTPVSFQADRAQGRQWRSPPGLSASPSAPTRRDQDVFPPPSTTSSG